MVEPVELAHRGPGIRFVVSELFFFLPRLGGLELFGGRRGLLLTRYVLPFEIASLLLTVALIGAIVIAREE